MISRIPKDVIVHNLIIYLSTREQERFLDTSRKLFKEIKYETLHFKVPVNVYFENQNFRTWLRSKLKNPELQLHLHHERLSEFRGIFWFQAMKETECRLTVNRGTAVTLQSRKLNRFPVLSIHDDAGIVKFDGPLLQRKLKLSSFSYLSDVNNLSLVQQLELRNCWNVHDVSALGNVSRLVIDTCNEIVDVSQLGNIPDLTLIHCWGIRNVSALKNNKTVEIRDSAL
jgi:hypothetical protein